MRRAPFCQHTCNALPEGDAHVLDGTAAAAGVEEEGIGGGDEGGEDECRSERSPRQAVFPCLHPLLPLLPSPSHRAIISRPILKPIGLHFARPRFSTWMPAVSVSVSKHSRGKGRLRLGASGRTTGVARAAHLLRCAKEPRHGVRRASEGRGKQRGAGADEPARHGPVKALEGAGRGEGAAGRAGRCHTR